MDKKDFRIVFMGTPDFAVESLKALVEHNYNVVGVVTNPDKPAGRGQKVKESAVKKYAQKMQLPILQPGNLKDESFLQELKDINPTLQVVVAFKILPPQVFNLPKYGTFNLHASLLPDYRGAAPINHAIINGEKQTGVTTFFLDEQVDTGKIIDKKEVPIHSNDTAGSLHDKLMKKGGELVVETVEKIRTNDYLSIEQEKLLVNKKQPKKAPKIFKENCRIIWEKTTNEIYNLIRGLSPYPAAWSILTDSDKEYSVKIFLCDPNYEENHDKPGIIKSDGKTTLKVACKDGFINIRELQLAGKKRMETSEFLKGFRDINDYWFI